MMTKHNYLNGKAMQYINQLVPGMSDALRAGIFTRTPIHFYGPGLGKSTLCKALQEIGVSNVSEAGECGAMCGCWSVPDKFSGLLVRFDVKSIPDDAPALEDLPELLRHWI